MAGDAVNRPPPDARRRNRTPVREDRPPVGGNPKGIVKGLIGLLLIVGVISVAWDGLTGGDEELASSSKVTPVERNNRQAKFEQEVCFEQANRIADQFGAAAGGDKLDQCVEQYARDLQVEP